ncbi:MAG: PLP-dependent transferase, partial [Bacteroidota bacterium]
AMRGLMAKPSGEIIETQTRKRGQWYASNGAVRLEAFDDGVKEFTVKVHYPFLTDNPQHDLAKKQMRQAGGQFSIELKVDSIDKVDAFCNALQTFLMACSWGGYESLIFPISTLYQSANYAETTLPWNFIRFYVGLEDPAYLIADLEQAFEGIS